MEHRAAADHVRARLPAIDAGALVDGGLSRPRLRGDRRRRAGASPQEHQLRTYESDGLLQYHALPARGRAARQRRGGPGVRAGVRARRACRGSRAAPAPGLSGGALPVADGVLIVTSRLKRILEIDLENQRVCVEPGVTNIAVSAAVAPGLLLSARPELADRLLDRRQRGRELRRRALLQVRLHDELRLRARGRAARRRDDHARRRGARPAGLRPARRVRRLGGHARDRDEGLAARDAGARDGQDAGGVLRLHARGRARRSRRSCRRASCRARSR